MSTACAERILGCTEPRIFTPPRRELTPQTSHGFACIAFAEQLLGLRLFPWQEWLLIHALELNEDGTYRFRFVIVEVARQNGKSLILLVLALWHLYALDSKMVIGTAQDLARAEKAWDEAVQWAEDDEELAHFIEKVDRGHPKMMRLAKTDETPWFRDYQVAAATRRGGRGFSGDLILLDELREHTNWESWAAVTNAMNARPRGQAWAFSNAGDAMSIVLRWLRTTAHQALGWPDGDADAAVLGELDAEMEEYLAEHADEEMTGWFEWSAPPKAKRTDRQAWAQANPSMNHTEITEDCVTERAIAGALRGNPPHMFETEVLCRWVSMSDAGPFPESSWADTLDNTARPAEGSPRVVCVDVSWSRTHAYVARVGLDDDGKPVAGISADRSGTDWVIPWLVEHQDGFAAVVMQSNGAPVTSLIEDAKAEGLNVIEWGGADLGIATGKVWDHMNERTLRHLEHPGLDAAATSAAIKVLAQGAWVIDRAKSPTDAAPLQAVIGAVWGLETLEPESRSAYEDEELMIV